MRSGRRARRAEVVGSGPNGLAAAIRLAQAGREVRVFEAKDQIGGGTRTLPLTLPGYLHDLCATALPLTVGSPYFSRLPLSRFGLEFAWPDAPLAHPLDDGSAVLLERSVKATAANLGPDGAAYQARFGPLVRDWRSILAAVLGPLRPRTLSLALLRFGIHAILPAATLARTWFVGERARALVAGLAAHSELSLDQPFTAAFALVLGILGHAVGWPFARGGSASVARALGDYLRSLGGTIVTNCPIDAIAARPDVAQLLDVTPRQLVKLAGSALPNRYRRALEAYRYGPAAFKIDWALDGPVPWTAVECRRAGTVHLGGTLDEVARAEEIVWRGGHPERPYVIFTQPTLFDPTRAPPGGQVGWAYCHVPNGSTFDMTDRIEAQIERFAPGFRDRILARHVTTPADFEAHDANYVGGDINGGLQDFRQLFTRPTLRLNPYSTPLPGVYLCSSATPPGGGVHGMCGYFGAEAAVRGEGA